ncbi:MAG: hypothetical protein ACK56F_01550, partial [bacterium]
PLKYIMSRINQYSIKANNPKIITNKELLISAHIACLVFPYITYTVTSLPFDPTNKKRVFKGFK